MTPAEWCREQIAEWAAKLKAASEAGDYPAFEVAERELANYKQMLERYEK
ncbi:hypothetical protein HMPREF9371_0658 [Neisseria shayeganii 871]|uniref:Uncharacterized protein n=1 Tax=Neisseria shayeganii 871 TaxID=1032488 RepID=G4CGB9_9NEIS|nr:hypothetical protein HMPREF9371_0658 [Neisseria shayeganii 871]